MPRLDIQSNGGLDDELMSDTSRWSFVGNLSVTAAVMVLIVIGIVTSPAIFIQIGNIKEGDWDYPQVYPRPNHFMRIGGVVDSSLDLKFLVHWTSTNSSCRYYLSFVDRIFDGSSAPYTVTWPLRMERDGEEIGSSIALDGVLPGRCGWEFGGLSLAGGPYLVQTNSGRDTVPSKIVNVRCKPAPWKSPSGEPAFDCRVGRTGPVFWRGAASNIDIQVYILPTTN